MSFLGERNAIALGVSQHAVLNSGPLLTRLSPSLLLQFAGAQTMDPRITFTRSTTATFTGQNGLIQSAAINAPRFDYNPTTLAPLGLLIEEQRTNLVTYSEQFDNAPWTTASPYSVTTNTAISPDGTQDADSVILASGQTSFNPNVTRQVVTKSASAIQYTRSGYFKNLGATTSVRLQDFGNSASTNSASVVVSLVDGSIVTAPSVIGGFSGASVAVTNAGNGWWRIAFTYTTDAHTSLTIRSFPYVGADVLTGDGSSGLLVWGVQLEAGAFATSYIPTVASQVTRAADNAVMTGTNFSDWYNQGEGTFYAEFTPETSSFGAVRNIFMASDNTTSNFIGLRYASAGAIPTLGVTTGGASQAGVGTGSMVGGTNYKMAGAYKVNDFAASRNAGTVGTDTSGTIPTVTQAEIGSLVGAGVGTQHIQRIVYYPRRLANSELQAITA